MHEFLITVLHKLLVGNLSWTDTFVKYKKNELLEKWNASWILLHYKVTIKVSEHLLSISVRISGLATNNL